MTTKSQADISLIFATRTGVTGRSPLKLLDEVQKTALKPQRIEVIIRGDNDDTGLNDVIKQAQANHYSFHVNFVKGMRGRGYEDLHNFYDDCLLYTSSQKKLAIIVPEDIDFKMKHWDQVLLDEYESTRQKLGHNCFTMQQTLNPGSCHLFEETIENPDSFPVYTNDWIHTVGFGYVFSVDSWVQSIHHYLLVEHGMNTRHFLPGKIFERLPGENDHMAHPRWANARLRAHDCMRSQRSRIILKSKAEVLRSLACKQMSESFHLDINRLSLTLNYGNELYGTASVLYKSMYNIMNNADISFLEQMIEKSEEIGNEFFTLQRVISADNVTTSHLHKVINNNTTHLHHADKYSYGQPYLSYLPGKEKELLRGLGYFTLLTGYIRFKISQYLGMYKRKKSNFVPHRQKSSTSSFLNKIFWRLRIKPLIKLIFQSKKEITR